MNEELEAIEYSKLMITEQVEKGHILIEGKPFSKYQRVYFGTNENIKEYLNLVDFNDKSTALSVMASGDHIFNLINKGIKTIDTFDTNALTEYLCLGLKYAMIKKYSYNEYLNIYKKLVDDNTKLDDINDILTDLLKYMDTKYKKYWKKIISYNYKLQNKKSNISLIYMLFINIENINCLKISNLYLKNIEEYNKLKNKIDNANISFNNINATDLYKVFNKKYDFILLSNILDYFNKDYIFNNRKFTADELRKYINNLKGILNDDGIIFLKYIFDYATSNYRRSKIFMHSDIKDVDLEKERICMIKSVDKNCYDGIILSKKY